MFLRIKSTARYFLAKSGYSHHIMYSVQHRTNVHADENFRTLMHENKSVQSWIKKRAKTSEETSKPCKNVCNAETEPPRSASVKVVCFHLRLCLLVYNEAFTPKVPYCKSVFHVFWFHCITLCTKSN